MKFAPLYGFLLWTVFCAAVHSAPRAEKVRVPIGTILLPQQEVTEGIIKYALKNFDSKSMEVNMIVKKLSKADHLQIITAVCQLMKEGVLAFVIPPGSPAVIREMLTSFSSHYHIPVVSSQLISLTSSSSSSSSSTSSTSSSSSSSLSSTSLSSSDSSTKPASTSEYGISTYVPLGDTVASLLRRYKWQKVAYIHDELAAPDILEAIQNSGVKISTLKKVKTEAEASDAVLELSSMGRVRPESVEKIVVNINQLSLVKTVLSGMIGEVKSFKNLKVQFILASLVTDDFWQYIRFRDAGSGLNVTAFRLVDSELPHVTRFQKQMMQNSNYRTLFHNQGTENYLFLDAFNALLKDYDRALKDKPNLLDNDLSEDSKGRKGFNCMEQSRIFEQGEYIAGLLKQVKLPEGQTGSVEFLADGSRLQPAISVIHGSHVGHVKLGSWSPKKGLTLTDRPEALPQIKAPGAITPAKEISVGGVLSPPYLMLKRGSDSDFSGFIPELLEALASVVPFAYKIHAVPHTGGRTDNGSWSGLMSEVINKKVEIAIADIPLTAERQQFVEYTQPFLMDDLAIVVSRKSHAGRPSLMTFFFYIFSWQLWLCILGIYSLFVVLAYFLNRMATSKENAESFCNTLWLTAGSFLCRSPGPPGRSRAGRLLLLVWWFFSATITVLYVSAFIAVIQTVVFGMGPDVFSVKRFVQDTAAGAIDVGFVRDVVPGKVLKTPRSGEFATIYSRMLSSPRGRAVPSVEDGVHAVSANFAFLGLRSQIAAYIEDCTKRVYVVTPNFAPYSIMMPKMSPYRDMFNQGIERLREAGILADLRNKWLNSDSRCMHDQLEDETPPPMKLSPVAGLFGLVLAGFSLALLLGAIEFVLKPKQDNNSKVETTAAQKALWDKNQDQGLRPYTPNDPALVSRERRRADPESRTNGEWDPKAGPDDALRLKGYITSGSELDDHMIASSTTASVSEGTMPYTHHIMYGAPQPLQCFSPM